MLTSEGGDSHSPSQAEMEGYLGHVATWVGDEWAV